MTNMCKYLLAAGTVALLISGRHPAAAEVVPVQPDDWIHIEATAYCYGTTRCDGGPVHEGIAAGAPEWYGKVAAVVWEKPDGEEEFLGYYEILDTGGESIRKGKVIDIYNPSKEWCINFGRKKVKIKLIDGVG